MLFERSRTRGSRYTAASYARRVSDLPVSPFGRAGFVTVLSAEEQKAVHIPAELVRTEDAVLGHPSKIGWIGMDEIKTLRRELDGLWQNADEQQREVVEEAAELVDYSLESGRAFIAVFRGEEAVRVELEPSARATLVAWPGAIGIDASRSLARIWVLPLDQLAAVLWRSRASGGVFSAEGFTRPPTPDAAPAMVDVGNSEPDVEIRFAEPLRVPFRHGRSLWPRTMLVWRPPISSSPRVLFPPAGVRSGRATSLVLRAVDASAMKSALEHVGLVFPEYSTGP